MDDNTTDSKKLMPKWLKWLAFFFSGILAFIVGQALVDLKVINNKWWLVTTVDLALYWLLFLKTSKVNVDHTITYDWGKKK